MKIDMPDGEFDALHSKVDELAETALYTLDAEYDNPDQARRLTYNFKQDIHRATLRFMLQFQREKMNFEETSFDFE